MKLIKILILEFWLGVALVAIGCRFMLADSQWVGIKIASQEAPKSEVSDPADSLPEGNLRDHPVMKKYMMQMTAEVRQSISGAFCIADDEHYGMYQDTVGNYHEVAGHCHRDVLVICLTPETVAKWPDVLDHEAAHAYHFRLRAEGSDFDKKWRPGHWITWYAFDAQKKGGDWMEDVAEWVTELKKCVRGKDSAFAFIQWNDDFRYNLYLLLEYKFVRKAEFREFLKKNSEAKKP